MPLAAAGVLWELEFQQKFLAIFVGRFLGRNRKLLVDTHRRKPHIEPCTLRQGFIQLHGEADFIAAMKVRGVCGELNGGLVWLLRNQGSTEKTMKKRTTQIFFVTGGLLPLALGPRISSARAVMPRTEALLGCADPEPSPAFGSSE